MSVVTDEETAQALLRITEQNSFMKVAQLHPSVRGNVTVVEQVPRTIEVVDRTVLQNAEGFVADGLVSKVSNIAIDSSKEELVIKVQLISNDYDVLKKGAVELSGARLEASLADELDKTSRAIVVEPVHVEVTEFAGPAEYVPAAKKPGISVDGISLELEGPPAGGGAARAGVRVLTYAGFLVATLGLVHGLYR